MQLTWKVVLIGKDIEFYFFVASTDAQVHSIIFIRVDRLD